MSERVRTAILKMIESVGQNPASAKLVYRADTRLEENVRCSARVRQFPLLIVDEPAPFGGGDEGMSPVELVLVALGTCQEIMYAALASAMDIPLSGVRVKLKGNLDLHGLLGMAGEADIPPGFTEITYETYLDSTASEETLWTLVDTVERQCPVLDMLTRPVPTRGKLVINGQDQSERKVA